MGPPPYARGHLTFTPYSGLTPGTPVFTHFTSARRRYPPHDVGSDTQQYNLKINQDGYKKILYIKKVQRGSNSQDKNCIFQENHKDAEE